ncbi:MAG: type VII secretion AAA-ATPase EccA [Mycobacteriaceae bacterium]|nr:type VII secretion AAA-ATPase EccA [Mycobacteriaceae bacterium]
MSSIATARRYFDEAIKLLDTDPPSAHGLFVRATEAEPAMADAWLGRIAAGDESLSTLENLHGCAGRLHRESHRLGVEMAAFVKAGPHLSIRVSEASHAGIALASALVDTTRFAEADALLNDPGLLDSREDHHWRQYVRSYLMFASQRWPDVLTEATQALPAGALTMPAVAAGIAVLAGHAATHLGQGRVALEWADRPMSGAGPIDPLDFPLLSADLAYLRGMAHRQLGEEDRAQIWLSKATVSGILIEPAKQALAEPGLQLRVTDEESITSRTDRWDVRTEQSDEQLADKRHCQRRAELLAEGHALLNDQVGLAEVKRAVAELEDQIEVRSLRLVHGLPVTNQTNHMLLVGPPGTGKTTTAEALGKIYAGLGVVRHPEIVEVKRSDFCGEHIGSSGPKTNELIKRSLGRILFLDEFYSLVERHHDGRPDMIGMEAVNQLLVALEVHRFDFCFIGAGYEREVDDFLTVNPGLASRFNRKLRFTTYSPDDLVQIAARYGEPRATVIDDDARAALHAACRALAEYRAADGTHGIDLMHNGRFARNIVERAERLRDSRVAALHRNDPTAVTVADLATLRAADVATAVVDACAEKHVPIDFGLAIPPPQPPPAPR